MGAVLFEVYGWWDVSWWWGQYCSWWGWLAEVFFAWNPDFGVHVLWHVFSWPAAGVSVYYLSVEVFLMIEPGLDSFWVGEAVGGGFDVCGVDALVLDDESEPDVPAGEYAGVDSYTSGCAHGVEFVVGGPSFYEFVVPGAEAFVGCYSYVDASYVHFDDFVYAVCPVGVSEAGRGYEHHGDEDGGQEFEVYGFHVFISYVCG